jgi:hypothetical protein
LLTTVAISYGAHRAPAHAGASDVQIVTAAGVEILTDKDVRYHANVHRRCGRHEARSWPRSMAGATATCKAHTRTLYTHMVDVPCYNERRRAAHRPTGIRTVLSEGTLHHVFRGGWLWVIPFNNHPRATNPLCSVGLQLDPRLYPAARRPDARGGVLPSIVEQFPDIRAQQFLGRAAKDAKCAKDTKDAGAFVSFAHFVAIVFQTLSPQVGQAARRGGRRRHGQRSVDDCAGLCGCDLRRLLRRGVECDHPGRAGPGDRGQPNPAQRAQAGAGLLCERGCGHLLVFSPARWCGPPPR